MCTVEIGQHILTYKNMGTINKYDWFKNVYYNKGLHSMEDKTEQIHKYK